MSKYKLGILCSFLALLIMQAGFAVASETNGTITSGTNVGFAWSDNVGWINFGTSQGNIHITDTSLTGSAWSSKKGWINLAPTSGGVSNNNGTLSGSAWSANLGWINFSLVTIDSSGKFHGTATGSGAGTITFDCSNCNVVTDWRPASVRAPITTAPTPSPTPPPPSTGAGTTTITPTPNTQNPTTTTAPAPTQTPGDSRAPTSTHLSGANTNNTSSNPATVKILNFSTIANKASSASPLALVNSLMEIALADVSGKPILENMQSWGIIFLLLLVISLILFIIYKTYRITRKRHINKVHTINHDPTRRQIP